MTSFADIVELAKWGSPLDPKVDLRKKDIELWKDWKNSGEHPDKLRPLLKQCQGLIHGKKGSARWIGQVDLPPAVIRAEFNKQFLHAARSYDPTKGTLFSTWAQQCLRKSSRYLSTYQNPARIIETRSGRQKGLFNNAVATLTDQFGREPTTDELSQHLSWAPAEVGRATAEDRGAIYSSHNVDGMDPATNMPSRELEVLRLVKPQLNKEETLVYEHLIGFGGKEKLKPGEIANQQGWNPSKVTRLKNSIADKMEPYLKGFQNG